MEENCQYRYNFLNYSINCHEMGHGRQILLCFHGFAMSGKSYHFLGSEFGKDYTIYAFDFLYHGETTLEDHNNKGINKKTWTDLIRNFLEEKKIERFSIVGYSMGGRLALALMENMPERLNQVILLAPDGVWNSFWFNFSTKNIAGKKLFKRFTFQPKPFYTALSILVKMRILSPKLIQIANHNTANQEKRIQVYNTWNSLTQIRINRKLVAENVTKHAVKLEIVAGRYDQVISLKRLKDWTWVKNNAENFSVIECGHLIPDEEISNRLRSSS